MKKVPTDWVNLITNSWMTPVMKKVGAGILDDDLQIEFPQNSREMLPLIEPLQEHIDNYLKGESNTPSLYKHLFFAFKFEIFVMATLKLITVLIGSVKPLLIAQFLSFLDPSNSDPLWFNNIMYSIMLLILSGLIKPILDSIVASLEVKMDNRYWTYMYILVYTKILRLSPVSRLKYEIGNIMNYYNRDFDRVYGGLKIFQDGLYPIIMILINFAFLQSLIGITAVYSALFYFLMFLPSVLLELKATEFNTTSNIINDKRVSLLREIFKSTCKANLDIKNIKFSNIEKYFSSLVYANVDADIKASTKTYLVSRVKLTLAKTFTTILTCLTFVVYSLLGNTITPTVVFPTYLYLDDICSQFDSLRSVIADLMNTYEAYQLVLEFLLTEEAIETVEQADDPTIALKLTNVTWKWYDTSYIRMSHEQHLKQIRYISKIILDEIELKENQTFALKNLDISIKRGSLVGIVGSVGAGKSTLFAGLTGLLTSTEGKFMLNGQISYFIQDPWIMNDDIKSNILFGEKEDLKKLEKVVRACGLIHDLNILEDGVYTKLGESGVNLSGGQKARIALARCLYSNSDIFLLDDPLAALDAYVGRQVFENAIMRELQGKTVLLATHQLQYMQHMDMIIVLDGGKIAEYGSFDQLISKDQGTLNRMMRNFEDDGAPVTQSFSIEQLKISLDQKPPTVREYVKLEKRQKGDIPLSLYSKVFQGVKNPLWIPAVTLGFLLNFATEVLALLVITAWANDENRNSYYIQLLLITTGVRSIVFYAINVLWFIPGLYNFKFYFKKVFDCVVSAPLYFFEETPMGRILNRFSLDMKPIDHYLFNAIYYSITGMLSFFGKSILVCCASPILSVLLLAAYSFVLYIRKIYDSATLEFKRYFSLYQSTGNSILAETVSGLATIASYSKGVEMFQNRFFDYFDRFGAWVAMVRYNKLWYQFRVTMVNSLISIGVIAGALLFNQHSTIFSSLVGLALTQAEGCTAQLIQLILYLSICKSHMNSFERIIEYIDETPNEDCSGKDLPKNVWPTKGFVEIEDLTVAYHSNPQKTVLNKLSASIRSGEKIGVVGRTGSGKSTLAMAFFRILEPIAGRILVDGVDIRELSLPTLRTNVDIIAQDTNLFSATIRFNLCLDQSFTDEELWAALDMVGMKDYVSNLPGKLEYILVANGTNLSAGQAQLFCLARVIVRRPKILILDEASSSIDGESDQILQSVLRNIFETTTIISIAHRLNTIADFDRILVLDQGQLVEYENPHLLLLDPNSLFSKLVESSGTSNAAQIREIAKSKFFKRQ